MGSQPRNFVEQRQYHDYLDVMNEERFRRNALGKMKDFQEGKKVSGGLRVFCLLKKTFDLI